MTKDTKINLLGVLILSPFIALIIYIGYIGVINNVVS